MGGGRGRPDAGFGHLLQARLGRIARSPATTRASSACSPSARGHAAAGSDRPWSSSAYDARASSGYVGVRMSSMDRMTSAHRVYERLGFTRAPEDDWSPEPGVRLLAYVLTF